MRLEERPCGERCALRLARRRGAEVHNDGLRVTRTELQRALDDLRDAVADALKQRICVVNLGPFCLEPDGTGRLQSFD